MYRKNFTDPDLGTGPSGPLGAGALLPADDPAMRQESVAVTNRTAAGIQSAIMLAQAKSVPVVLLPAGDYPIEATVSVPAGMTLRGEGAATRLLADAEGRILFDVQGERVRLTRLALVGWDTRWSLTNNSRGVQNMGHANLRVDHAELYGFSYGLLLGEECSAQVDHCLIHHNLRAGLGYGIMATAGAWLLAMDNEFSQNRISLASSGAIDTSTGGSGTWKLRPDVRLTRWELLRCFIHGDEENLQHQVPVDTHPSMGGTFVVEGNRFENLIYGLGIRDGRGLIRGNLFRDFVSFNNAAPLSVHIRWTTHNGTPVEGAMPREIQLVGNANQGSQAFLQVGEAANIWLEGELLPETYRTDFERPAPISRAAPMTAAGELAWAA